MSDVVFIVLVVVFVIGFVLVSFQQHAGQKNSDAVSASLRAELRELGLARIEDRKFLESLQKEISAAQSQIAEVFQCLPPADQLSGLSDELQGLGCDVKKLTDGLGALDKGIAHGIKGFRADIGKASSGIDVFQKGLNYRLENVHPLTPAGMKKWWKPLVNWPLISSCIRWFAFRKSALRGG